MTNFTSLHRRFPTLAAIFASGANRVGDLFGFVAAGIAPGVALPEVNGAAADLLVRLAGAGVPLFLDSGAFSEVEFGPMGPQVKAPITDAEWQERLGLMQDVAAAGGHTVTVVAPDQVGFQGETLARLARYAAEVRALVQTGARVLIPLQRGSMGASSFYIKAQDAVGAALVPALPMKKGATPPSEAVGILAELDVASAHLLGLGIKNSNAADILRSAAYLAPRTQLTIDGNLITANVGRASGLRPLTRALDDVRDAMTEHAWSGIDLPLAGGVLDYTDLVSSPSEWMSRAERKLVAHAARLSGDTLATFLRDPDAICLVDEPALDWAVDAAWRRWVDVVAVTDRQARATAAAFADHPAAGQFTAPAWVSALVEEPTSEATSGLGERGAGAGAGRLASCSCEREVARTHSGDTSFPC